MTTRIQTVAEGIVTWLNAQSFSQEFTATFSWAPDLSLTNLATLTVSVTPQPGGTGENPAVTRTRATRASENRHYLVDVGVAKQVDPDGTSAIGTLIALCEEIVDAGMAYRTAVGGARILRVDGPIWDPQMIRQDGLFLGVLHFTMKVID